MTQWLRVCTRFWSQHLRGVAHSCCLSLQLQEIQHLLASTFTAFTCIKPHIYKLEIKQPNALQGAWRWVLKLAKHAQSQGTWEGGHGLCLSVCTLLWVVRKLSEDCSVCCDRRLDGSECSCHSVDQHTCALLASASQILTTGLLSTWGSFKRATLKSYGDFSV